MRKAAIERLSAAFTSDHIIQPLLDNARLGTGDEIDHRSTSVSCADVALLEAKGFLVGSDCG